MTEEFKAAVHKWLNDKTHDVQEILEVRQYNRPTCVCGEGTCWEDVIVVRIYYVDNTGYSDDYDHEGSYVDFIRELTDTPDYMLD